MFAFGIPVIQDDDDQPSVWCLRQLPPASSSAYCVVGRSPVISSMNSFMVRRLFELSSPR